MLIKNTLMILTTLLASALTATQAFGAPQPSPAMSLIPLEPVGKKIPADKEPPWFFYIYESPMVLKASETTNLYPQSLKLKNWQLLWFIVDENEESYYLGEDFDFTVEKMDRFKLRCYVRYDGVFYEQRQVTWKSNPDITYPMQFSLLSQTQLDQVRPEVLLLPAQGVELPTLGYQPSLYQRIFGGSLPKRKEASGQRPDNVVILMMDTLRRDHTPPGGHESVIAPHIDMLAQLGTYFENSYGASSSTRPSVGSLFTGLHPLAHGAKRHATDGAQLYSGVPLLAQQFKQAGFQTATISSNAQITDKFGFDRGFDIYECPVWESQVTPKGLSQLRQLDEPFFLYLHYLAPHQPYEPPDVLASIYEGETQHKEQDRYLGEISLEDRRIGRIIKELAYQGLLNRTLVWLVSDHGEEFWEHGWNGHGANLYEESVETLSIAMYPRMFQLGQVRREGVTHVDIFPTLSALFNWSPPQFQQGKNLLPNLRGENITAASPRPLFLHHGGGNKAGPHESDKQAILYDQHKLVWWTQKQDKWEYYDLAADPGEQENVYRSSSAAQPKQMLQEHIQASQTIENFYRRPQDMQTPPKLTAKELENLRALGYVD